MTYVRKELRLAHVLYVCKPDTQTFSIDMGLKWRGPTIEVYRETICTDCAKKLEGKSKDIILHIASKIQPEIKELLKSSLK